MLPKGTRVQLHAATSDWMRGDRYGTVTGYGKAREYVDAYTGKRVILRPLLATLDKSGTRKRFHPDNVFAL